MKAVSLTVLFIAFASFAAPSVGQDARTIRIATEGAFPPWNSIDTSGSPVGYDVEVGLALCKHADLSCEFVTQAWDGIIPGLNVGKYDAIMAGMSITDKRKEVIAFTVPYALTSNYFVMRKAVGLPDFGQAASLDLSDESQSNLHLLQVLKEKLKGRTIGVQGSTNAEAFVQTHLGEDVTVRIYDKQDNLNLDLVAGRIDGGLADFSVWKTFLDSDDGEAVMLYGPRISGGLFGPGVGIGLRKGDDSLKIRFNQAIDALSANGTLASISLKWFGTDLATK